MTLETFLDLATQWDNLGSAVQEQFREVLDDTDTIHDQNPNALKLINRELLKAMINSGDDELAAEARDLRDEINEELDLLKEGRS